MIEPGERINMHKIKIIEKNQEKKKISRNSKRKNKKNKTFKINDNLFEIGLRKGLIEKNSDEYYFIGDYEELLAFKNE